MHKTLVALQSCLTPVLAALSLVVGVADPSHAQASAIGSLSDLRAQVEAGEKVRVLRVDGQELRGELIALDSTGVDIDAAEGVVRITAADIREIGLKDGVYNGLLIGMGTGLAAGLLTGLLTTSPDDGNLRGFGVMLAGAAGLGVGLGLGAVLDARAAHYTTIYRSTATVRVTPLAAPGAYGASIAIAW